METVKKWQLAALGVLVVMIVGLLVVPGVRTADNRRAATEAAATYTPPPRATPKEEPAFQQVATAEAMARLDDPDRTFTIAVLGDSTGADRDAWVNQLGPMIGNDHDRPVILHPWQEADRDGPTQRYLDEYTLQGGSNAPIVIYNGSAPNRDLVYSREKLAELIPVDAVDLVLVNHGHNVPVSIVGYSYRDLVDAVNEGFPDASLVTILQNPQIQGAAHYGEHQSVTATIKRIANRLGVPVIDVQTAFEEGPASMTELVSDDEVHPTTGGYTLWAETVYDALTSK